MKKIIPFFCFIVIPMLVGKTAFAQTLNADSIVQLIAVEKDEDKKVDLIFSFYSQGYDANLGTLMEVGQALLNQSNKNKDILTEASAYCFIGFGYRMAGNFIKGLEYHQKALALAEKGGNFSILAMAKNQMGHIYRDREEYDEGLKLYSSALFDSERGKNNMVKAWPLMNIGAMYLKISNPDSALSYLQRSYVLTLKYDTLDLPYVLWNLGGVHSLMGNAALAITYYNMSIQMSIAGNRIRQLNWAYLGLAEHYQRMNQHDSCLFYAKKSIAAVENTAYSFMSIRPAKLLTDMYEKNNCDSTLKYAAIYKLANDSLYSKKENQQIQLMTFDENLRQQGLAAEKIKSEAQRKQNIQYALLGFGIISFIILFLALSRRHITNTKLIQFLGIIALLLVFEFLNLLLHPFLEHITNHSPALMLLALVCIAALLVPLHHKLVEKNKQIRLASAKKTIEELERK